MNYVFGRQSGKFQKRASPTPIDWAVTTILRGVAILQQPSRAAILKRDSNRHRTRR
jgi:hypothetical protein